MLADLTFGISDVAGIFLVTMLVTGCEGGIVARMAFFEILSAVFFSVPSVVVVVVPPIIIVLRMASDGSWVLTVIYGLGI
jgi:hypothetical protein